MDPDPFTTGPLGARETSGVEVRLGAPPQAGRRRRGSRRARGTRRRADRRGGPVAAGMLALAVLAVVAIVLASLAVAGLLPSRRSDGGKGGGTVRAADAPLPRSGTGIEVGTADGARYRIAAVTGGVGGPPETSSQSPPSRTAFAYVEYILTNPTKGRVLLDFPGDVFVRRALVTPRARGRCMPQAGVPENLCTPPTTSEVVRRLAGGELIPGNGGARYMPPGASYLVRATVDVPVARALTRKDMRLYVWRQLYMADRLAEQAPFPR